MNDCELDRLLQAASPATGDRVTTLDLEDAESELLEEILTSPAVDVSDLGAVRERRSRRHLMSRGAGAIAGVASAAVLLVALLVGGGTTRPDFADAAVRVAEANSRLLVGEPGWSVTRIAEFTVDDGEMTFSDGRHELDVHWIPARLYRGYLRDRAANAVRAPVTVLGRQGTLFRYPALGDPTLVVVLPPDDSNFVEIRGDVRSTERYRKLLASLTTTDVETWLAALPPSAVRPGDRERTVDELLAGVPIPPGIDPGLEAARDGVAVMSHYDLVALVSGTVACGWLDRWSAARERGDDATARKAVAAMSTARDWPLFATLSGGERAGYPSVLWDYADAMRDPAAARRERNVVIGFYRSGLGCGDALSGG